MAFALIIFSLPFDWQIVVLLALHSTICPTNMQAFLGRNGSDQRHIKVSSHRKRPRSSFFRLNSPPHSEHRLIPEYKPEKTKDSD